MRVEDEIKLSRADVKVVERENLHFTVKFLGEIPDPVVDEVDKKVSALSLRAMKVDVRGLGAFPDPRRPRVVWAGVALPDLGVISSAGQQVIDALEGVGESDDRGYHPHITVARVRSPRNVVALTSVLRENANKEFGRTEINSLKLKSSDLTPRGPVYRDLKEYPLR